MAHTSGAVSLANRSQSRRRATRRGRGRSPPFCGSTRLHARGRRERRRSSPGVQSTDSNLHAAYRRDAATDVNRDGIRVDVENPAPDRRPGQVHLQIGREEYIYDPATQSFKNAPPRIQRLLEREDIQRAIEKGLRYLDDTRRCRSRGSRSSDRSLRAQAVRIGGQ